ncbi:MAG: tRNA lysidine(34) synthetase TilS [Eubacterium sp.]|nr:tRNA lysidine(34) synthetase TilS [Eubacterium sp.]
MESQILKYISEKNLIQAGDRVLIGVSGGADSLALLYFLHSISQRLCISVAAAHLHHGLRGAAADGDAEFVKDFCLARDIPFYLKAADVSAQAQLGGRGLEEAGREARRAFFAELAAKHGFSKVALAHHQDDQAETVLMRLIRGTGVKGAGGMAPLSTEGSMTIVRPFLCVGKADICAYCDARGLAYRTDATNFEAVATRNKLRLSVMPALEAINPGVKARLCDFSELARGYEDFLEAQVDQAAEALLHREGEGLWVEAAALLPLHPLLQRALLRRCILTIKGSLKEVAYNHIEKPLALLRSQKTVWEAEVPGGLRLRRSYDLLWIEKKRPGGKKRGFGDYPLPQEGRVYFAREGLLLEMRVFLINNLKELKNSDEKYFDCGKIKGRLHLRGRKTGDYFYAKGMQGRKKLKDFFIDTKTDREIRDSLPLLACGSEILWSPGRLYNAAYTPDDTTRKILAVRCLPLAPREYEEN